MRQKGVDLEEDRFRAFLGCLRKGECTEDDVDYANSKVLPGFGCRALQCLPSKDTLTVSPNNGHEDRFGCKQINQMAVDRLAEGSKTVHNLYASHTFSSKAKKKKNLAKTYRKLLEVEPNPSNELKLQNVLQMTIGSRVMLHTNQSVCNGLVNGSLGSVYGFLYPEAVRSKVDVSCQSFHEAAKKNLDPPIVLVEFDDLPSHVKSYVSDVPNVIPIPPQLEKLPSHKTHTCMRCQVPLCMATCITIHKCQGATVSH